MVLHRALFVKMLLNSLRYCQEDVDLACFYILSSFGSSDHALTDVSLCCAPSEVPGGADYKEEESHNENEDRNKHNSPVPYRLLTCASRLDG